MADNFFRLASYTYGAAEPRAGAVVDDRVVDVGRALSPPGRDSDRPGATVLEVLGRWDSLLPQLRRIAQNCRRDPRAFETRALAEVRLHAPILYPGTIFCAGANYRDHVAEMSRALNLPEEPDPHSLGLKPWHFIKPSVACVRGPDERIALPSYSRKVDWEAEIAVVMGRACRDVGVGDALSYVAGLCIVNDLSARDHLRRAGVAPDSPFHFDWVSQKSFDGALPIGPWIVPLADVGDPAHLGIRLSVNGEVMQDSSSSNMIFSMAEQIAHLSSRLTLQPGDVIATGTPAGCGAARGRFLEPGDRVSIWVEGIGTLTNEFTA